MPRKVKNAVNQLIAQVVGWSLRQAARGEAPATGCFGETLEGDRAKMAGSELALGWRACYFGSKYDAKARKEINQFPRSYLRSLICETCLAQKKHKNWIPELTYKNFYASAGHRLTKISLSLS